MRLVRHYDQHERETDGAVHWKEEGDIVREYNAMHEENIISSWPREDLVEKEERREKVKGRVREEEGKKVKREEGKEKRRGERRERDGERIAQRIKKRCRTLKSLSPKATR